MREPEFDPPFEFIEPARISAPLLLNSPHSGTALPESFLSQTRLEPRDLLRSADLFMDQIIAPATLRGVAVMHACFPRAFLDVNREPYELDARMFDKKPPAFANTRSLRVVSGYGTVPRLVAEGFDIYARRIPLAEAMRRIDSYYLPYHSALRRRLNDLYRAFGTAVLIDCHSMPAQSLGAAGKVGDVILGDRHGTSCAPELIDFAEALLRDCGLTVSRNQPYSGGFITEHYGNPRAGTHALQIEFNRALYMDEETYVPHNGLLAVSEAMMHLVEALADLRLPAGNEALPLAAE